MSQSTVRLSINLITVESTVIFTKKPAVSVIIPVWNGGDYFPACLDSVIFQTLKNIEVIIVDDASTDGSSLVADEYAARDSRFSIIHQKKSMGAGPARNIGMALAQGEFIAFMDSDDLYPSVEVLETLYTKAVEQKANICGGSLYTIDGEGGMINKNIYGQFFTKEGLYNYSTYQYDGGFYRFIYKNSFLKQHGLYFPCLRRFQDAVFFVKSMTVAKTFYAIPFYTYAYRKNHKNIVWTYEKITDHLNGLHELIEFSLSHNFHKLHYLMVKNFLDSINYKIKYKGRIYFIFLILKIIKSIDWSVIRHENKNNKVKISFCKIFYKYFLKKELL